MAGEKGDARGGDAALGRNARNHLNGRIHCRQNLKSLALSSFQCVVRGCELVGGQKKARVGAWVADGVGDGLLLTDPTYTHAAPSRLALRLTNPRLYSVSFSLAPLPSSHSPWCRPDSSGSGGTDRYHRIPHFLASMFFANQARCHQFPMPDTAHTHPPVLIDVPSTDERAHTLALAHASAALDQAPNTYASRLLTRPRSSRRRVLSCAPPLHRSRARSGAAPLLLPVWCEPLIHYGIPCMYHFIMAIYTISRAGSIHFCLRFSALRLVSLDCLRG
ncbi:hypothetical protein B0H13DRAFT_2562880 [Mycena leptocephala]|nr:hypothetical protein B0H13DRAFT_2562880 [Mycena leptocephala]